MSASLGKKNDESFSFDGYSPNADADWDTPFKGSPSSAVGEFSSPGTNATPAAHNGVLDTEQKRSPLAGG